MATVKITILSGTENMRGTSFTLTNESYSIGRSDTADICIPDPTISGHHCTLIRVADDSYAVKDEGSTNGTRVNGEKVTDQVVNLRGGDILQVGGIEILFDNSDEHHTEMRTMTVINLDDTGTVNVPSSRMKNLGAKQGKSGTPLRENKKSNMVFYAIIGVLGLAVAGVMVWFVARLLASGGH